MILSEARPPSSRQPTICHRFRLQTQKATGLRRHWVTPATMLCYAMNVICLPDRALTGDFGTGIAGLSLLSRFGRNICTATPSRMPLKG
jgi:hypothetical protein